MNLSDVTRRHGLHPKGVLHVGAGNCDEAEEYSQMGLPVIWVEGLPPDQKLYDRAAQFGQLIYQDLPLSDTDGEGIMRVTNNVVSSSLLPLARHSDLYPDIVVKEEIKVKTHRAESFFKTSKQWSQDINTLVLDTQGNELPVLKGMGFLLNQFSYVIAEVYLQTLYEGCSLRDDLSSWLKTQGFVSAEFEEVHKGEWGNELFIRDYLCNTAAIQKALQVPGLMSEEELDILAKLFRRTNGQVVVETGTYMGRTASLFAALGAVVFTIDDYSGRWAKPGMPPGWLEDAVVDQEQVTTAFKSLVGCSRVFPLCINTYTGMELLKQVFGLILHTRKADLVFLDGNHNYEVVVEEMKLAEMITAPGGIICGHDLDFDSVSTALKEHRGKDYETLSTKLWAYPKS